MKEYNLSQFELCNRNNFKNKWVFRKLHLLSLCLVYASWGQSPAMGFGWKTALQVHKTPRNLISSHLGYIPKSNQNEELSNSWWAGISENIFLWIQQNMLLLKQGLSAQSSRFLGLQQSSRNQDVHVLLLSVFEMSQFILTGLVARLSIYKLRWDPSAQWISILQLNLAFSKKKTLSGWTLLLSASSSQGICLKILVEILTDFKAHSGSYVCLTLFACGFSVL